ncbi:MAG: hypothetical protein WBP64_06075 [Nitrososphaeraceae archaeon]
MSNTILLVTKIKKSMTNITTFNELGDPNPLYDENSTIVESNTITAIIITIRINAVFLFRLKLK